MANKERPLPKPPHKAFGRKNNFEQQEEQESLIADRMAQAAAEGKLDEFLKKEMPDNEYARNLASMMMGMTGMMPGAGMSRQEPEAGEQSAPREAPSAEVPEDVRQAIVGGDVQSLMGLLRREHARRNPDSPLSADEAAEEHSSPPAAAETPSIDKKLLDVLIRIAKENSVSLDWVILRAIKVYVQEYEKSGKL